jgi:hypothetical protein
MAARGEPKTHVVLGGGTACNSRSMAAVWRGQTCERCSDRIDRLVLSVQELLDEIRAHVRFVDGPHVGLEKAAARVADGLGKMGLADTARDPQEKTDGQGVSDPG